MPGFVWVTAAATIAVGGTSAKPRAPAGRHSSLEVEDCKEKSDSFATDAVVERVGEPKKQNTRGKAGVRVNRIEAKVIPLLLPPAR
jgi:hypothetical protein